MKKYPTWLKRDEKILRVYKRHFAPFLGKVILIFIVLIPFYVIVNMMQGILEVKTIIFSNLILSFIGLILIFYIGCMYWYNRLILTNERLLHVDWQTLTHKKIYDILKWKWFSVFEVNKSKRA